MKHPVFYFMIVMLMTGNAVSQTTWEKEADLFMHRYYKTRPSALDAGSLDNAINNATQFISGATTGSDSTLLSDLYAARASLRFEKWRRRAEAQDSAMKQSDEEYALVENDYKKALTFSQMCECRYISDLEGFYAAVENGQKEKEIVARMKELGVADDLPISLGLGLSYMTPGNIVGAELTLVATTALFPKKSVDPSTGKKYRPCGYMYPRAFGFLALGYEASVSESVDPKKYNGVKLDLVWFNYFASVRLSQFLYCNSTAGNSFVWRPEIGYSFSTFSINYALNVPFKRSFNYLPLNSISIRIVIPAIKLE